MHQQQQKQTLKTYHAFYIATVNIPYLPDYETNPHFQDAFLEQDFLKTKSCLHK